MQSKFSNENFFLIKQSSRVNRPSLLTVITVNDLTKGIPGQESTINVHVRVMKMLILLNFSAKI